MSTTSNSYTYLLVAIGLVSAFGPFVTDFYLPTLPALAQHFNTTASMVQMSLTCSIIGLAAGQLIIGPLSDKYGRKRPLLLSLVLFCLSTVGCLHARSIEGFITFRLLQGLAGAGGVVLSKSIAADLFEGHRLTRFFSLLSSIQGLAPICAPVLGGLLLEVTDWKGIFFILLALGLCLFVLLLFFRESLPASRRQTVGIIGTFRSYLPMLRHTRFMCYTWVQAFAMGVMFTYISASPFIFQTHYGLSPLAYSLCFGANAIAIMVGSLWVSRFRDDLKALRVGVMGFTALCLATGALLETGSGISLIETALFASMVFLGFILPSSTALALGLERRNSGKASALLGFLSFLLGGILSPLTGWGDMLQSTALIMVLCCLAACGCLWLPLAGKHTIRRLLHRNSLIKVPKK